MFIRRRYEQEPTRWYRLADSDELFTALHEAPKDHPLLPASGQTAPPLRRFVPMQSPEAQAAWSSQAAMASQVHSRQLATSLASFSSAETMMRPLLPPNRYNDDHYNGLRLKHMRQSQQPFVPLQHLLPPQRQPVSQQQQPQLLQPLPRPLQPPDPRLHQTPMRATQLAEHGGRSSPAFQVPSGSLPWQARAQPLTAAPQMTAVLHGGGVSRANVPAAASPMNTGPVHRSPMVAAGCSTAATQPLKDLPPAAAVAAVAAIEISGGRNSLAQSLQATATYSGPATLQSTRDTPVQLTGPYLIHPRWQGPAYQQAAGPQGPVGWDAPPLYLERGPLMQPAPVDLNSPALRLVNVSGLGPPDMSSISSIQQWLLLVPDHSKMALEKAWFMSVQRATKAAVGPSLGGMGRPPPTSGDNRQGLSALWEPVGERPLKWKATAASQFQLKAPTPTQPAKVAMKAQGMYHLDGTALTPELVLHYTNLLYGEDWDKQLPWPEATPVLTNMETRVPGAYIGHSPAQGTANTNQSSVSSASGTKRLYNMYNRLLGRAITPPKLVHTAISPAAGQHSSEIPAATGAATKQNAQPLACLPYMPELMEHITKAALSRDAPPSPRAIQYIPKTAVWQAAWAAQRAAPNAAAATARDLQAAASANLLGTEPGAAGHTTLNNTLYACEQVPTKVPALGGDGTEAVAHDDGPIPVQHQMKQGASRWRDRHHMESVLAPVFVVDLDSGQVAITYIHGHGRSEVQTQTDRCNPKDGVMMAAGDSSDAASYSSHSSVTGSGTDMTVTSSSSALTSDDIEDSESTSESIDQHPTHAVTTGRIAQLLKSMNIFGRWYHRGEGTQGMTKGLKHNPPRQGQAAVASGDEIPAGPGSVRVMHKEGDGVGTTTSDAQTAAAVDKIGAAPGKDNKVNAANNGAAVDDRKQRKIRRKTEEPQICSSGTSGVDSAIATGASGMDHQQVGSHQQRTKEKVKVVKEQRKAADAGLKGSASDAVDGAQKRSKHKKSKSKADNKPPAGSIAPNIVASTSTAVGDRREDTKPRKSTSPTPMPSLSVATTNDAAANTAVHTAVVNNDGTMAPASIEEGGASSEKVDDDRHSVATPDQAGRLISHAAILSKVRNVVRHFNLQFWKRSGSSQPRKATDGRELITRTESAASDEVVGEEQQPAVQQQESLQEVVASPPEVAVRKANWKGFYFLKHGKIKLKKHGDSAGPKMAADNMDAQDVHEVKDNNVGANNVAENNKDDGLRASGQTVSIGANAAGSNVSKTVHTPALSGSGSNKTWLQRLYNHVIGTSVLGRFPGAKQQPSIIIGSSLSDAQPDGQVHNKEEGQRTAGESMQQSPGEAAVSSRGGNLLAKSSRGQHSTADADAVTTKNEESAGMGVATTADEVVQDLAEVENQEANDLGYEETSISQKSMPLGTAAAGKAMPKKGQDDKRGHAKNGDNDGDEHAIQTTSKVKAKVKAAKAGLFAKILGWRHHQGGTVNISQQVPRPNASAITGVIAGRSGGPPGIAVAASADAKKATNVEGTAADGAADGGDEVQSRQAAATETTAGVTFEPAGPMSAATAGSTTVSSTVLPPAIDSPAEPEVQALLKPAAASGEIEEVAPEGLQTSDHVTTKVVMDGKGKEVKKAARKAGGKKLSSSTAAAAPSIVLPPPQGPKAKLMQKLLRLSDAVNAQRAAAAASSLGDDVSSSHVPASSSTTAAAGVSNVADDAAASRKNDSTLRHVGNTTDDTSQNLSERDEPNEPNKSSSSGLQQQIVQLTAESTAVPIIGVSVQNKSKALERLKNTLARTRGRQASSAASGNTDGDHAQALEQDSSGLSHVAPQGQQQEQVMWGTRSQHGNPAADSETDASSKPAGGKATMMERMMASLRRPKHQAEVQEMAVFMDGQNPRAFGAANTSNTASGSAQAAGANETTIVTAMRSSVNNVISTSSIPVQSSAVRGASSPASGAGSLNTTSRLNSTTRSDLGASSPFGRQVHQAENLMASIRKLHQTASTEHEVNLNNTIGRNVGTAPGSPATSGGWTVHTAGVQ
ncbi:hypothetical protein Vafri_10692 [Volvox africanus]|uniref:Uncharacterized protein n=1 Tax=Volvox africanus TaxID=51714 RepID=A0A8J4F0N5_9CHLO|nr:hypothetical protein Vafri_10692 [Volvox africanus]